MIRREPGLRDSVTLLGEREDVPDLLATSDVFVLSSRWEGLPRAIIEAMFAGLPVVATDVGGSAELVENGATGFVVEPRNPRALAEGLQKLLDDPMLRRKMGEAGRRRALECFDIRTMLESTYMVYRTVTGL
jgi:glycosyltransferase involved in cell wall biosynthesis